MQAGDRGINDLLSRRFPGNTDTEHMHDQMCRQINGRIIDATSATAPRPGRRQLYLMLDAYRADRAHSIPEPPMTDEQLYDAMVNLSVAK